MVPFAVIQKRFSDSVRGEVIDDLIRECYVEAIKEQKITPVGTPRIDVISAKPNEPLNFTVTFEIYPELKIPNLSNLEVEKYVSEVTDKDVDDAIEKIQKQHTTWKEITDPNQVAKLGDQMHIDFTVKVWSESSPPIPKQEKDVKFVLGSGTMWSEFETPLLKAKAGDEVKFTLKFPLTHFDKELVGKHGDFVVKVKKICEPILPELNDAFAAKLGMKAEGVAGLKAEVKKNLEHELAQVLKMFLRNSLLEKLVDTTVVDVPKVLLENELHSMEQNWKHGFARQPAAKKQPVFPRKDFEKMANRQVSLGLILAAILKNQDIKVAENELRAKIAEETAIYEDSEKAAKWVYSNKEKMREIEASLLEEKAIDYLQGQFKLVEKPISYKEIMKKRDMMR